MTAIRVGVAGLGYWGPNLARNFAALGGCELAWLCDARRRRRSSASAARSRPPAARAIWTTCSPTGRSTPWCSPRPCPPMRTWPCACSRRASTASSRSRSPRTSRRRRAGGRRRRGGRSDLMVGHLLEYHPAVAKLKAIAASGELGDIHYIYSNRLNLGKLRADENALWSLGAHDVSVVLHLAGEEPYEVEARGESYMRRESRTSSSVSCASPPGSPRICTCRGWTRTRSAASPSSAPGGWRRSTTWTSSARSPSSTRASISPRARGASTSRAPATSTAPRSRTASRCGSSASTSSSASARGARRCRTGSPGCGWSGCWPGCRRALDASRRTQHAAV